MAKAYKVTDSSGIYFITITVIGWVDLFTRKEYRDIIIDSLKYCIEHKGLVVYGYVIMSSHIHMIVASKENELQDIIRDFKKFTSKAIVKSIQKIGESRREWLLNKFSYEAQRVKRGVNFKIWKDGYHGKQIQSAEFMKQKLDYIHNNPVESGIVLSGEEYLYSSAKNYAEHSDLLLQVELAF